MLKAKPPAARRPAPGKNKPPADRPAAGQVYVWCDGSCYPNPNGMGGWAAVVQYCDGVALHELVLTGCCRQTTNNRMELLAAVSALERLDAERPQQVTLFTDSQYVSRGPVEWVPAWRRKGWAGVTNADLWQRLDAAASRHQVKWRWVRGHSGNEGNERCDQLAGTARIAAADHPDWHVFPETYCARK